MKIIIVGACVLLSSCSSYINEVRDLQKKGYTNEYVVDALNSRNITNKIVYRPVGGVQRDDSIYISETDLLSLNDFVKCEKKPYQQYQLIRYLGSEGDEVKPTFIEPISSMFYIGKDRNVWIKANRPNCTIDTLGVKQKLDLAIETNQRKAAERVQKEIYRERRDPKKVFLMGCNAYISLYKGMEYMSISDAVKSFPDMNEGYVRRLYQQGWRTASSGIASNAHACSYYSYTSLVVQ